jgi:hypothetical protein
MYYVGDPVTKCLKIKTANSSSKTTDSSSKTADSSFFNCKFLNLPQIPQFLKINIYDLNSVI